MSWDPMSVPPAPTSFPPVPPFDPPDPISAPPAPDPISAPPVPISYPPVPVSYPPVPSFSPAASQRVPNHLEGPNRSSSHRPASNNVRLSVVVVARNEVRHLAATLGSLMRGAPASAEFVVVDDGSDDGTAQSVAHLPNVRIVSASGVGCAPARNLGWRASTGDIVVFSDAHVEAPEHWWAPLAAALEDASVGVAAPAIYGIGLDRYVGYGLRVQDFGLGLQWLPKCDTRFYPVPVVSTCFIAFRRDVLDHIGGFDGGLDTWGHTDLETSLRAWLFGWKVVVVPEVEVGHLFRPKHPYPLEWRSVLHNALRVAFVYFDPERMARVVDALRPHPAFPTALTTLAASDFFSRRTELARKRVRHDGWDFERLLPT